MLAPRSEEHALWEQPPPIVIVFCFEAANREIVMDMKISAHARSIHGPMNIYYYVALDTIA
jgi:hypothetical protein